MKTFLISEDLSKILYNKQTNGDSNSFIGLFILNYKDLSYDLLIEATEKFFTNAYKKQDYPTDFINAIKGLPIKLRTVESKLNYIDFFNNIDSFYKKDNLYNEIVEYILYHTIDESLLDKLPLEYLNKYNLMNKLLEHNKITARQNNFLKDYLNAKINKRNQ